MRLAQLDRASDYGSEGREFRIFYRTSKEIADCNLFFVAHPDIRCNDTDITRCRGQKPPTHSCEQQTKVCACFLFCKLLYLRCDQCLIFKVVDLHGCLYFFQGLCSNCFCFLTSGLQNFINCRNILLPLFSAVTDRL